MLTETPKMIYPTKEVAAQIAEVLSKEHGTEFSYAQVTTGWQIAPVTKCPSAMPPWPPLPFKKKNPLTAGENLPDEVSAMQTASPAKSGVGGVKPGKPTVVVKLKLQSESPAYMNVYMPDGKLTSFGKTTLISWAVVSKDGVEFALLEMDPKTAKKRGVADCIVEQVSQA